MSEVHPHCFPIASATVNRRRSALLRHLNRLVEELVGERDGESLTDCVEPSLARWGDEDNVYVEAKVSGTANLCLDADICIMDRQVFIRVGRGTTNPLAS